MNYCQSVMKYAEKCGVSRPKRKYSKNIYLLLKDTKVRNRETPTLVPQTPQSPKLAHGRKGESDLEYAPPQLKAWMNKFWC